MGQVKPWIAAASRSWEWVIPSLLSSSLWIIITVINIIIIDYGKYIKVSLSTKLEPLLSATEKKTLSSFLHNQMQPADETIKKNLERSLKLVFVILIWQHNHNLKQGKTDVWFIIHNGCYTERINKSVNSRHWCWGTLPQKQQNRSMEIKSLFISFI